MPEKPLKRHNEIQRFTARIEPKHDYKDQNHSGIIIAKIDRQRFIGGPGHRVADPGKRPGWWVVGGPFQFSKTAAG